MKFSAFPPRSGWIAYALLVVLVVSGITAGWYLSRPNPSRSPTPPAAADAPDVHRFPLTHLDIRETGECADLGVSPSGDVLLTWASRTGEDEWTLFFTRSTNAGTTFDAPQAITTSPVYRVVAEIAGNPVTFDIKMAPHLAASQNAIHLAWTEALPDVSSVQLVLATAPDGEGQFGETVPIHRGQTGQATYTALSARPDGTLAAAWLDNRNGSQQIFASIRGKDRPQFNEGQLVHAGQAGQGVCPCCPTQVVVAPDGTVYVAFRNLEDGYRDIALGVRRPGSDAFEGPYPVLPPTWECSGCPHDGPSMALIGDTLHVAWMDARTGSPRCYVGSAQTSEMNFQTRALNPIPEGSQGNSKLVADREGGLHAVWEESRTAAAAGGHAHGHGHGAKPTVTGDRMIMYAYLPTGETDFRAPRAVSSRSGAMQTRPAMTVTPGGEVVIAWSELDESGKSIVVTRWAQGAGHD